MGIVTKEKMEVVKIGNATLIFGDCTEIMPQMPNVNVIVTDPPYGMAYTHSGKGAVVKGRKSLRRFSGIIVGDNQPFDPLPWLEYDRLVLFGANHYSDKLPASAGWLVWDKKDMMPSNSFSDAELIWTRGLGNAVRRYRYLWNGVCQAGEKGQKRFHPNQKPIALMEWILGLCKIKEGDVVGDPYMGAGSTGIAAARLGIPFVGIEIDRQHFDTACERISREVGNAV